MTEEIFGLDLVGLQIAVGRGDRLPAAQPPVPRGAAIEARLNSEDPDQGFEMQDWHRRCLARPAQNFDHSLREHAILTGHSTTTPVAEVARAAGVRRLVLTHLNAMSNEVDPVGLDVARAIFPQTWLATDGLELEF